MATTTTATSAEQKWMVMAMREKLIELLAETPCIAWSSSARQMVADHLIANGVTIPVRCHECEHWKNEINGCTEDRRFCNIGYYMVHKDGFCSFGEKKTENK